MSERFYVSSPLRPGVVALHGAEAHHLAAVCRLHAGDQVCLFNGDGHEYPASVTAVAKRTVTLDVLGVESPQRELSFRLEVATPLPKGDRSQFLIEKLTELGATRYVPLLTHRSVVQPRESTKEKLERWVIEASKQCGRNVLMEIGAPAEWANYSMRDDLPATRLLAQFGGGAMEERGRDVVVAIGPEGGFMEEEIELARAARWQPIGLGPRILRVETAALALCAAWVQKSSVGP
jgi:16S rRNA (uracil1498-N3)-methyltransferase